MKFEIAGPIENIEVIAAGRKIRVLAYLQKTYGPRQTAQWRCPTS
jgi:hypothetical protein